MAQRRSSRPKVIGVKTKRNYVVEDYRNPPEDEVQGYRTVRTPTGHLVRVAIMKRPGPRGGRTKATSLWHPKGERSGRPPARRKGPR